MSTVWLLWRNDQVVSVCGTLDRAKADLTNLVDQLRTQLGGTWRILPNSQGRVWTNDTMAGCRVEIEERPVKS